MIYAAEYICAVAVSPVIFDRIRSVAEVLQVRRLEFILYFASEHTLRTHGILYQNNLDNVIDNNIDSSINNSIDNSNVIDLDSKPILS